MIWLWLPDRHNVRLPPHKTFLCLFYLLSGVCAPHLPLRGNIWPPQLPGIGSSCRLGTNQTHVWGAIVAMETKGDGRQRRRRLAGCFLKVKFHFLSTYFPPFCDTPLPPPARLHPVVHRSTFNSPKIYIFHLHHLLYVFFFINTTNTDRWANSANLEILWNCYVMRLLCFRILVLHWFIAVLPLNSTSLLSSSHSPMFDVEFCFSQAETRPKRREKVTAKTFLWLYVATPERSANSPLSLPVVQRRFNKVFNHRPIRLGVVEEWAGTAERQQQSCLLAKLWNINANFYKNSFSFLSFFSFFTWIKTSETKCEHFLLSPPRVTATEAFS